MMKTTLAIILSIGLSQSVFASDKKRTKIDFEDELIEGSAKKPELMHLMQRRQFNFRKLIKLRKDFLPEMRRTSEDLRRTGSQD